MDDGGSHAIIIITAVFLFFSLVAVSLRCFVRLKIVKAFGRDDVLMVTAMVSRHTQSVMHSTHLDLDLQCRIRHVRHRGRYKWNGKINGISSSSTECCSTGLAGMCPYCVVVRLWHAITYLYDQ